MKNKEEIYNKAKQLHQLGKIREAQELYLQLIEEDNNNIKLNFLIGTSFLQLKNYQKAKIYLNNSIKIDSNIPHIYNSRGIVHSKTKKFQDAINDFNKAILLKENFLEAYLNKGIVLKNIKKFEDSLKCFEEC